MVLLGAPAQGCNIIKHILRCQHQDLCAGFPDSYDVGWNKILEREYTLWFLDSSLLKRVRQGARNQALPI